MSLDLQYHGYNVQKVRDVYLNANCLGGLVNLDSYFFSVNSLSMTFTFFSPDNSMQVMDLNPSKIYQTH